MKPDIPWDSLECPNGFRDSPMSFHYSRLHQDILTNRFHWLWYFTFARRERFIFISWLHWMPPEFIDLARNWPMYVYTPPPITYSWSHPVTTICFDHATKANTSIWEWSGDRHWEKNTGWSYSKMLIQPNGCKMYPSAVRGTILSFTMSVGVIYVFQLCPECCIFYINCTCYLSHIYIHSTFNLPTKNFSILENKAQKTSFTVQIHSSSTCSHRWASFAIQDS